MDLSDISKDLLPSAKQVGSSLSEITSDNGVMNLGGESEKLFEYLLDTDEMVDGQEDRGEQSAPFSLPEPKACIRDKTLSTTMYLPTLPSPSPENYCEHFPVTYCCCRTGGSHDNPQYSNQSSSSATIDPVRLSRKETMEPPYPFIQPNSFPFCDGSDDPPPLALLRPLTNALHHNISGCISEPSTQQSKSSSKRGKQRKNSPVPPVTAIRCLTLGGHRKNRHSKGPYNPKTSYLLNTLLFESFGNDRKPTKAERRKIQHKTGISSRHLTYWLSNHKRRFKSELMAYRRLQRSGKIDCYEEYMEYCKKHHVPELSRSDGMANFGDTEDDSGSLSSDDERAGDADEDDDSDRVA